MSHHDVVLTSEICTLIVLLGLGAWRIHWTHHHADNNQHARNATGQAYDMRRDGQRYTSD